MFQFIETPLFTRISGLYLDDDEYAELQQFMLENPEAGVSRAIDSRNRLDQHRV